MDYRILHAGVDTLDVAFKGAFPEKTLDLLEAARTSDEAQRYSRDVPVILGHGNAQFLLKPHGQRGGYQHVLTNGPMGAIFSVKNNSDPQQWNVFVSVRSLRLLTAGFEGATTWLRRTLRLAGFQIVDISVNRVDYAIDLLAPGFVLDASQFVCTGRPKVRPYWSKEQILDDDGSVPRAVIRGRNFESVTVGTMPGRQVIVYDKRRAAIDQQQPYWFDAWGIDRTDPSQSVWRVEFRAGREGLIKLLAGKAIGRPYDAVEAYLRPFLLSAARQVRYTVPCTHQANISRLPLHPMWEAVEAALHHLPVAQTPSLPEEQALAILRQQRTDMAEKLTFGNLINLLVLQGQSETEIVENLTHHAQRCAGEYLGTIDRGDIGMKIRRARDRAEVLSVPQNTEG